MKAHRIIRTLLLLALCSTEVVLAQDKQNMFCFQMITQASLCHLHFVQEILVEVHFILFQSLEKAKRLLMIYVNESH